MGIKLSKTKKQLIETLLSERNLKCTCLKSKCNCEKRIKEGLKKVNYFQMFNGLENILLKVNSPKDFEHKISYSDFERLYTFDKNIGYEILKASSHFEEKLKSSISYHFTQKYCQGLNNTMQYTNMKNYENIKKDNSYPFSKEQYGRIQKRFQHGTGGFILFREHYLNNLVKSNDMIDENFYKDKNYKAPPNVCKYKSDKTVAVPFWVAIQTLSLGEVKHICHYLKTDIMNQVLLDFDLKRDQRNLFLSALDIIIELRNHCAHGKIIFKFKTPEYIKINKNLVSMYGLNPRKGRPTRTTKYSEIYLFDALVVLSKFVSGGSIYKQFKNLIHANNRYLKKESTRVNDNILKAIKAPSYESLKKFR